MDLETAIRTRRTHKVYGPDPVDRATLTELLELARWAPNHHLTPPWRFRVIGPAALERLKEAGGPHAGPNLDRAPTHGGGRPMRGCEARPGAGARRRLRRAVRRRSGGRRGGPAGRRVRGLHR